MLYEVYKKDIEIHSNSAVTSSARLLFSFDSPLEIQKSDWIRPIDFDDRYREHPDMLARVVCRLLCKDCIHLYVCLIDGEDSFLGHPDFIPNFDPGWEG